MSGPDMEADENGAKLGHTGGWSQRDEIVAFWCPAPAGEADPGAFPGRMTVAPRERCARRRNWWFPSHRSLAPQTVVEDCCREGARRAEERWAHASCVTGNQVVSRRSPATPVGSELLLAAFMRRHPWNVQAKRACRAGRDRDEHENSGTLLAARPAGASSRRTGA